MFPRTRLPRPADRRGAILIVVVALLTIFAVVALTFVFYASAEADAARIHKDGQALGDAAGPPDPADAINGFLASLVYPADDTDPGALQNALRGHDLARGVYGWTGRAAQATYPSYVPFAGTGPIHQPVAVLPGTPDRARVPNHTAMIVGGTPVLLDPEYYGTRAVLAAPPNSYDPTPPTPGTRQYQPKNAGYTYPDSNNMYLASVSPLTGEVLTPSFYRAWQFRDPSQLSTIPAATGLEPPYIPGGNPNWTTPDGRAYLLRPRPADQTYNGTSEFPYCPANADGSYTGDVQNLPGGYVYAGGQFYARNDSLWMHVGLQPRKWNGRWVVPLIAPLVLDLDGRLNYSAHGNSTPGPAPTYPIRAGGAHVSHHGFGPWEVSLEAMLGAEGRALVQARQNTGNANNRIGDGAAGRGMYTFAAPPYRVQQRLPASSLVNWDGTNSGAIQAPGALNAGHYMTSPRYAGTGYNDNMTSTTDKQYHPSLFNPAEWLGTPASATNPLRTFSQSDLRFLSTRYAADRSFYLRSDLSRIPTPPTASLLQGTPATYANNLPAAGQSTYRLDPVHQNRLSVTPFGATLDTPGFMPGTFFPASPPPPANPANYALNGNARYAVSTAGNALLDNLGTSSASLFLPPVDLNRPLADYRDLNSPPNITPNPPGPPLRTPQPLSVGNAANTANAQADRYLLARDIFARLCLATGGAFQPYSPSGTVVGYYNPDTTGVAGTATVAIYTVATGNYVPGDVQILAGPTSAQFAALRNLAQLAVNIVDYIDNDDVCTIFPFAAPNPAAPYDPATLPTLLSSTNGGAVVGVERPRLILNEAYSEIANDPTELNSAPAGVGPTLPAHFRFWVELLNPTSPAYLGGTDGPLGNGSVAVGGSAYRIRIYQDNPAAAGAVQTSMMLPGNVIGDAGPPKAEYILNPGAGAGTVAPNNGQYGGGPVATARLTPAGGMVMVGPTVGAGNTMGMDGPASYEFNPTAPNAANPAPWTNWIQSPNQTMAAPTQNAMEYLDTVPPVQDLTGDKYKRHVVMLQRRANPYLTPPAMGTDPTNPFVTVDYMDYVPSFDAMKRAAGQDGMTNRPPKPASMNGYDPDEERFSVGKVQPYAGYAFATYPAGGMGAAVYPNYSYTGSPRSFVLKQQPSEYDVATQNNSRHTFGRHNGVSNAANGAQQGLAPNGSPPTATETLMAPFDMMMHLDRPLINQAELFTVTAVSPHQFTQTFVRDFPAGTNPRKDLSYAPWVGSDPTGSTPGFAGALSSNQLYRALELLRVRPWGYGTAMGGKVHGRINVNTVQDPRVLLALFDPQAGNAFTPNDVYDPANTNPYDLWKTWINTRTPLAPRMIADPSQTSGVSAAPIQVPVPGPTVDDWPGVGVDRPFKPFGAVESTAGPGYGLQDTVLRTNGTLDPVLRLPAAAGHLYQRDEPLRKVLNNITTVSNTFVVIFTISYFEVRTDSAGNMVFANEGNVNGVPINRPILGKEAYKEVPGDLRQQYVAVVDRSNIAIDPNPNYLPPTSGTYPTPRQSERPFFTATETPTPVGSQTITVAASTNPITGSATVYADGVGIDIRPSATGFISYLVLGSGPDQTTVAVADPAALGSPAIVPAGPGVYTVTLAAPVTRYFPAGTLVSNAKFGNPGPPTGVAFDVVDPNATTYRPVVPYWSKVR